MPITAKFPENADKVRASVQRSPKKSLRRRNQELGISITSIQCTRKNLSKFPYKMATCHELTDTDKQRQAKMCNRVAEQMGRFPNWIDKVWFTDDEHFRRNSAVKSS